MRCFIAIDIDEEIRAALHDLQQDLAGSVDIRKGDVKWVRPETMHLTLKFLGEIRDRELVDVCRVTEAVAAQHEAFSFAVKEVGHFGGRSARVLWVGAGLDCPELVRLQEDLEGQLAEAGWPKEGRKFSGHLTLCRVRNTKAGFKLAQITEEFKDVDLGTVRCASLCVYQSTLTAEGPIYTTLGNYRLS
ncbi:MAG: RNA 2',3'-cyclic phosphodiesterase [Planctomycetota bacterium]|jgi:2'-5' RNA ligase